MNLSREEKPYLKKRFTRTEIVIGIFITGLVMLFLLVFIHLKGWELSIEDYVFGALVPIPFSFGLVVGARYYFRLLEKLEGNILRIPLLLFFIPLVVYTGWLLFLVKGYVVIRGKE